MTESSLTLIEYYLDQADILLDQEERERTTHSTRLSKARFSLASAVNDLRILTAADKEVDG